MKKSVQIPAVVGVAASLILLTGACGGGNGGGNGGGAKGSTARSKADPSLAKLVPADIRSKGTLAGGTSFDTQPMNFYAPGNKPDGMLIDLLDGAAARLGLTITWSKIPFPGLIPALESQRIDIAGAQISKTPQTTGVVNLLAFYETSTSLLVPKGKAYTADTDACGTRFGMTGGSALNQNVADLIDQHCKAAGKPALKLMQFPSFSAGEDAVRSGRIDSFMSSTPQIQYARQADPTLGATLFGTMGARRSGVALPLKEIALTKAFQAAFNSMIADGEYKKILDKWGLSSMAIDKASINDQIPMG